MKKSAPREDTNKYSGKYIIDRFEGDFAVCEAWREADAPGAGCKEKKGDASVGVAGAGCKEKKSNASVGVTGAGGKGKKANANVSVAGAGSENARAGKPRSFTDIPRELVDARAGEGSVIYYEEAGCRFIYDADATERRTAYIAGLAKGLWK